MYFYQFSFLRLEILNKTLASPKNYHSYYSCCDWNLNSVATDNYSKVVVLKAYNSIYKHDFICISETFLDSSFESDDKNLILEVYNLIQSDDPSNTKRVGVLYLL